MGEKLYGADDILKKFKGVDKALDNLWCALDKCCAKHPINIGEGLGLYKQFYDGKWQFKSLLAGDGITFEDTGYEIVINAEASPFDCQDVLDCLGISDAGDPNKFLNEQGDWITISGSGFTCTDLLLCSTSNLPEGSNLYFTDERAQDAVGTILTNSAQITFIYNDLTPSISASFTSNLISQFTNDAGYITSSGASLTGTYVGYGSGANTLTGNSDFVYDTSISKFELGFIGTNYFTVDAGNSLYRLGDAPGYIEISNGVTIVYSSSLDTLSLDGFTNNYRLGVSGGTNIALDNNGGNKIITLNAVNGVYVSPLSGGGTEMVVADATGLLSKQAIPSGFISSVTDTATIDLDVTLGVLTANFINSAGYTTNTGTVTSVSGSGGTTGLTLTGGAITTSGTLTLGGTLIAANGGTGFSSYTVGDLLYADTTTTLAKLADVATTNVLKSGGIGAAPLWGKVVLTTDVSGILPSTNGGTDAWVDYSATSTITGFSAFTTKLIRYQNSYKRVHVSFMLAGTSNTASVTFTLPIAAGASSVGTIVAVYVVNNGTPPTIPGRCFITGSTVTINLDFAGNNFTAAGSKTTNGEIWYEID